MKYAAIIIVYALAACGEPTRPLVYEPHINILRGADQADTIGATLKDTVVPQVANAAGAPVASTIVHIAPVAQSGTSADALVFVGAFDRIYQSLDLTTDASGRVSFVVRFQRPTSGPVGINLSVPALSIAQSMNLTILPGRQVTAVVEPSDTAVMIGRGYKPRVSGRDRLGNSTDNLTYTLVAQGPEAIITPSGDSIRGASFGRASVTVQTTVGTQQINVSVLPSAIMAARRYGTVVIANLDGSNQRDLGTGGLPDWSWQGDELVFLRGSHLMISDTIGTQRSLIPQFSTSLGESQPAFAADRRVYFTIAENPREIWSADRNGGDLRRILVDSGAARLEWPAPSPTAPLLAFNRVNAVGESQIIIYDFASGTQQVVTSGFKPKWSPNGQWLAYRVGAFGVPFARTIGVDGSPGSVNIAGGMNYDWTPDSRYVVVDFGPTADWKVVDHTTGKVVPVRFTPGLFEISIRPK